MITVDRVDHLVLTCRDIAATVAFYTDVLGMKPITFAEGRLALVFGRQKINLHAADASTAGVAALPAHPTAGSVDLCLIVEQTLTEVVEHLRRHGVAIHEGPIARTGALGPIESVYLRDPDGNLIELSRYPR